MNAQARPSAMHSETISATASKPISAVNDRTALTLAAISGTIFISDKPDVTTSTGMPIIPGMQPFTLCQCHGGDWVKKQLFAVVAAGSATLVIIEGFEPYPPKG